MSARLHAVKRVGALNRVSRGAERPRVVTWRLTSPAGPPTIGPMREGVAFGPFVVDTVKRCLFRDGRIVPLTSKTFDVLLVLLERPDQIVSKEELLNHVWPHTAVNENNLARQISSLRRALGQRPDQHDFVVTVPGQGYRFVAAIRELPAPRSESAEIETTVPPLPAVPAMPDESDVIVEPELISAPVQSRSVPAILAATALAVALRPKDDRLAVGRPSRL